MLIESLIKRPKGTKITLGVGLSAATYHFQPDSEGRHVAEVTDQGHAALLLANRDAFRSADGTAVATIGDASAIADEIEGPFFIVRGPQDLQAFAHWASAIPDLKDEVEEYVLLIDKIAIGEASMDGYALPSEFSPFALGSHLGTPPAPALSPRAPADNTILPTENHHDAGTAVERASGADAHGDGAGAAGSAGATPPEGAGDEADDGGDDADGEDDDGKGAGGDATPPAGELDREALAKEYDELMGHRPNGKWSAEKIRDAIAAEKAKG
ncbi:hypothetical protein EDF57_10658 [Novosphingobium sp. PhB55]|uniref:hypothetical protein n=1 Tax=Novosphingobium sp. PhB55 TaxID=2485106 RepID=UPI00106685FB|nr:hypothetical protein [Novosphingobium sp. PhB55]TDW63103.1 hypothetical protein EDF57_10658 [Novosphingobium sp. PhB55]